VLKFGFFVLLVINIENPADVFFCCVGYCYIEFLNQLFDMVRLYASVYKSSLLLLDFLPGSCYLFF